MFDKIEAVIFYVNNIEKSKEFYLEKLGFIIDDDQGNYVSFKVNKNDNACLAINLVTNPKKVPGKQTVLIKTDNIDKAYEKLQKKNVNITKKLQILDWGKTFAFTDIDGNKIEITE